MQYPDFILSLVKPMVADVAGEHGRLSLDVELIPNPMGSMHDFRPGAPERTLMRCGWGVDRDPNELTWVRISIPGESLDFAMGASEISVDHLNSQIDLLAEEIEGWLAETSLAWGQLCRVPRPVVGDPKPWD